MEDVVLAQILRLIILVNVILSLFIENVHTLAFRKEVESIDPWEVLKQKLDKNLNPEDSQKAERLLRKHFDDVEHEYSIPLVDSFDDAYDFIIIGSGPGGAVMANRLSEINDWKVLLLEAGDLENALTDVPLLASILHGTKYDWNYKVKKQTKCCQGDEGYCKYPRGKALGGTSVINGLLYVRGNKDDYNAWQNLGNYGWSYNNVLNYFKKSEDIQIEALQNSPYHRQGGYLTIDYSDFNAVVDDVVIDAAKIFGYKEQDNNGANQTGVAKPQAFLQSGKRCSASKTFIKPVSNRKNLSIATGAFVTKILIDPKYKIAQGVTFTKNNINYEVKARKEVILSAGTISSPQILMLSGIGPKDHLKQMGIEVIRDLPVGKWMKDHLATPVLTFDMDGEFEVDLSVLSSEQYVNDYFERGSGPLTLPDGMSFLGSYRTKYASADIDLPDVEIFYRVANMYSDINMTKKRDSFYAEAMLFHPKSVGTLKLNSNDPKDHPIIDPNCFAESEDTEVLVEALKLVVSMSQSDAYSKYNITLQLTPDPDCDPLGVQSDAYWRCFLRRTRSADHQVGTCRMGPISDPRSVVDPLSLKPYGIHSLRVVDASVIPESPTGHTTAVIYMIAERAADIVKKDWRR